MNPSRILVVEDEVVIARDLQMSLENLGYTVCATASSGLQAIEKAEKERPDLVLMDIMLKGKMDGIEAASQILSRFGIPVVYLTAYADDSILERAKPTEPFGYLIKPFNDRELRSNIEVALYKQKAEKEKNKLIEELQAATAKVKTLSGLLPICSSCKKIRDDSGYWKQIESYIREHSEADFTHSICPDCAKELYGK